MSECLDHTRDKGKWEGNSYRVRDTMKATEVNYCHFKAKEDSSYFNYECTVPLIKLHNTAYNFIE